MNRTFLYSYDDAGNILTSVSYVLSLGVEDFSALNKLTNHRFNYDANGRLSEYVGKGSFTYDSIGNPIKYRGRTLTWKNGRQLATFTRSGVTYEFDYNADGIRTYKAGGGLTTQYVLNGSQVMRQIINDGTTTYIADYIYHENGTPLAFAYYEEGGTPVYYFYETNLQGDIINIYDENGAKVVGFRYDAWGNFNTDKSKTCTKNTIGEYYTALGRNIASITWRKSVSKTDLKTQAFIDEYELMCKHGGPNNSVIKNTNSLNRIWSPGRKMYFDKYGKYIM